jgi:hypothetical protein
VAFNDIMPLTNVAKFGKMVPELKGEREGRMESDTWAAPWPHSLLFPPPP